MKKSHLKIFLKQERDYIIHWHYYLLDIVH